MARDPEGRENLWDLVKPNTGEIVIAYLLHVLQAIKTLLENIPEEANPYAIQLEGSIAAMKRASAIDTWGEEKPETGRVYSVHKPTFKRRMKGLPLNGIKFENDADIGLILDPDNHQFLGQIHGSRTDLLTLFQERYMNMHPNKVEAELASLRDTPFAGLQLAEEDNSSGGLELADGEGRVSIAENQ